MADELDIDPSEKWSERLFPDETTEEALARIVAQDPLKHGVTLEQRRARATALASRVGYVDQAELTAEDARIVEIGGDPNEMLPGNKPRYTVDEAGNVKDHETGEVHQATIASEVGDSNIPSSAETLPDILRPTTPTTSGDETRVEEIHGGEAVVEEGHSETPEGLPAAGAKQDPDDRSLSEGDSRAGTEPNGETFGDGAPKEDQSTRLAAGSDGEPVAGADDASGTTSVGAKCETESIPATVGAAGVGNADHSGGLAQGQKGQAQEDEQITFGSFPLPIPQPSGPTVVMINPRMGPDGKFTAPCREHVWPGDPQPETPCTLCGLNFEKWANS